MIVHDLETGVQGKDTEAAGPGAQLAAARHASGITVAAVCEALRLEPGLILALERDDYGDIPPVFVRGYLRQYARLLRLPEAGVVDAYHAAGREPSLLLPGQALRDRSGRNARRAGAAGYLAAIAMGLLALVWWQSDRITEPPGDNLASLNGAEAQPPVAESPAVSSTADDAAGEPLSPPSVGAQSAVPVVADGESDMVARAMAPTADRATDDPKEVAAVIRAVPETGASRAQPEAGTATTTVEGAEGPSVAASVPLSVSDRASSQDDEPRVDVRAATQGASGPGAAELLSDPTASVVKFEFVDDCWVEVTDAAGKRLLFNLYTAGNSRVVQGVPPLTVVLGNASGVKIEYNGRPFDHLRYRDRRGVAQFELGDRAGRGSRLGEEAG